METPARHRWTEILASQFLNRRDHIAVEAPWGKPAPVQIDEAKLTDLLTAHVQGGPDVPISFERSETGGRSSAIAAWRLGSYTPTPGTNLTKWICVDVDGSTHKAGVADAESAALRIFSRAEILGIPAHIERSKSEDSFHVWILFEIPVSAKLARELGLALCPTDIDLIRPTRTGETLADPTRNRGLEVFPKQTDVPEDGFGNLVWLPWYHGNQGEGGHFVRIVRGRKSSALVTRNDPTGWEEPLATVSEAAAKEALAKAGGWKRDDKARAQLASDRVWKEWRTEVLEKVELSAIYGDLLTGKEKAGRAWFECRDPNSPSGDRHPSAGVSTGLGHVERGAFHSFLDGTTVSVFDFMVREGKASTFMEAVTKLADLTGIPLPAKNKKGKLERSGSKPQIITTHNELCDLIQESWEALHAANHPPKLFRRDEKMVELKKDNRGKLMVLTLSRNGIADWLSRAAQFVRLAKDGPQVTIPPDTVTRRMAEAAWDQIPTLDQVVTSPFFDSEGNLVNETGYHAGCRTWFQDTGLSVPDVPEEPTAANVDEALGLLTDDLLGGFPFVDASSRCHTLAMLVLPFVRYLIEDETPAHLIEGPATGTGKTLLAKVVYAVALGERAASIKALPKDENEIQKWIFAELRDGPSVVCFDNLPDKIIISSESLLSCLTTTRLKGRVLKSSEMESVPNLATWILTGNNPRLSNELARRCVRIRMDAGMERPQDRPQSSFPHELPRWAIEERGKLIWCILTLVRYWIAQGRPAPQKGLSAYHSWSQVVGGILTAASVPGWLENLPDLYEEAESESEEWAILVQAWSIAHPPPGKVSSGDIMRLAVTREVLPEQLRTDPRKMGLALNAHRDQVFSGHIIRKAGLVGGSRHWTLQKIELVEQNAEPLHHAEEEAQPR